MRLLVIPVIAILAIVGSKDGYYSPVSSKALPVPARAANDSEKIYSSEEVDKRAEIKSIVRVLSSFKKSLGCKGEGVIKASLVLRKSGKVSDIKVENSMHCNGKEKALNILRRIKFTPALKNRLRVSQYETFEIRVELQLTIG